jgi:enolase-phosphatase E1
VTVNLSALHIGAVVLDIEGTTTPVEFVYRTLFPFARAQAAEYLERERHTDACREAVALLREEQTLDVARGESPPEPIPAYVLWLMDRDRKSRGLKLLQGHIWEAGYRRGELRGHVFGDVPRAMERWQPRGIAIYIYSSGSVLAQRLLFGSTPVGDLTKFLRGYFDTAVGPKTSADSYRRIAGAIGLQPAEILFVSDVEGELDAAADAGFRTLLCVRSDGSVTEGGRHPIVRTFDDILE